MNGINVGAEVVALVIIGWEPIFVANFKVIQAYNPVVIIMSFSSETFVLMIVLYSILTIVYALHATEKQLSFLSAGKPITDPAFTKVPD